MTDDGTARATFSGVKTTWTWNQAESLSVNVNKLAAACKAAAKALGCSGYWFDYGSGEVWEFKRWSDRAYDEGCYFMAQAARDSRSQVVLSRNMNGQLRVRLGE